MSLIEVAALLAYAVMNLLVFVNSRGSGGKKYLHSHLHKLSLMKFFPQIIFLCVFIHKSFPMICVLCVVEQLRRLNFSRNLKAFSF